VYLRGGDAALGLGIDAAVQAAGRRSSTGLRLDRFATAVAIAGVLGNPATALEATGLDFPTAYPPARRPPKRAERCC